MSANPAEVADNFKENVLKLIDYLISIIPHDSDLLSARLVTKMIPTIKAIENFAKHIGTHRVQIENEDEQYFLSNDGTDTIFADYSQSKVVKFKTLWQQLDKSQKSNIWTYFKYFIRLSDRYCELKHID